MSDSVHRVTEILADKAAFSRDIARHNAATFGEPWVSDFDDTIRHLFLSDDQLVAAVEGYARFALESLRLQHRFEKTRQYAAKTFREAAEQVYFNERYMLDQYLPGLLLSHFLWPHHYRQVRFFIDAFVSAFVDKGGTEFTEVGIGTGIYSRILLRAAQEATGIGFDISEHSKAFAERHVSAYGLQDRLRIELRDVVDEPPTRVADWLICVEVLEHLEDPPSFLASLRLMLSANGKAFITTALNAANADHIHLYENVDQVTAQLLAAGFSIEQHFLAYAYRARRLDQPIPAVVAFIVEGRDQ